MKIAGNFRANEWSAIRTRLNANDPAAWCEAVTLLRGRIGDRYLKHAGELLNHQYSGFAILAIDCAIVEALEQFRKGVPRTPHRKSDEFFRDFFLTTQFKQFFTAETSQLFYETVRCGILHQAESNADTLVKKSTAAFVVKKTSSGKGIVINAKRFHEILEAVFEDYITKLLTGDTPLRKAFIQKMNYITRSTPDSGVLE
jgi:hypothetical protein